MAVVDLRTLVPYDWETIAAMVRATNRVIIAHEDQLTAGFGGEIAVFRGTVPIRDASTKVTRSVSEGGRFPTLRSRRLLKRLPWLMCRVQSPVKRPPSLTLRVT